MYEVNEYVYCIYEECHGLVGIWTDEKLARDEVDRLSKNYEGIEPNAYSCKGAFYGNDMISYQRTKVNVPW